MINEGLMFLYSYGYYGGAIGNALARLEQMGFFSYVLPFLLIFTLVFGILSSTRIFRDNRGVDAVIALVVGLLALQFDFVPVFFSQVFPRMGVALAAILVILIVAGFFVSPKKAWQMYILLGIGVIAAIAVVASTFQNVGFYSSYWIYQYLPEVALLIAVVVIVLIVTQVIKGGEGDYDVDTPWRTALVPSGKH